MCVYMCAVAEMHFLENVSEQHPYLIPNATEQGKRTSIVQPHPRSTPYNYTRGHGIWITSQDAITAKQNLIKNQFLGSIKPVYFIFLERLLLVVTQVHCVVVLSVKNTAQNSYLNISYFYIKPYNFILV